MPRLTASLALLAAALAAASARAELQPEALEALPADDACAEDPSKEECSASFRQLRGLQTRSSIAEHGKQNASNGEDMEAEPGVCCFSGEDMNDVCGTCYHDSISTDVQCSMKGQCSSCGGTWCRSVCVMGAADPTNKCGTAFDTGIADKGTFCASNGKNCASCNGEWCKSGTKRAPHVKKVNQSTDEDTARAAVAGFCCYRAEEGASNMCADCSDVAKDETCSTEANCGTCGGTWCAGPKCVTGFMDPAKPCTTVFPQGIADSDSYCSHSKDACSACKGSWCTSSSIKYYEAPTPSPSADDEEPEHNDPADESPADGKAPAPSPGANDEEPEHHDPADESPADGKDDESPADSQDDGSEEPEHGLPQDGTPNDVPAGDGPNGTEAEDEFDDDNTKETEKLELVEGKDDESPADSQDDGSEDGTPDDVPAGDSPNGTEAEDEVDDDNTKETEELEAFEGKDDESPADSQDDGSEDDGEFEGHDDTE